MANSADLTLSVKNVNDGNASDVAKFTLADDSLKGDADVVNVELASNSATYTLDIDDGNTSGGIETMNIDSSADNAGVGSLTTEAQAADKIVISGSGDLDLTGAALDEDVTVDGSNAAGDLKLAVSGANDVSLTGGSGNDVFDFGGAAINSKDVVAGGDGVDEIRADDDTLTTAGGLTASNAPSITGIETVFSDNTLLAADLDLKNFGASNFKLAADTSGGKVTGAARAVNNLSDGGTVTLGGQTHAADLTLNVTDATDAGENANELNLNLGDAGNFDINVPGVEILNIDTTNALGGSSNKRSIDLAAGDQDLETINVTGDEEAEFDQALDGASIETINASTLTAALTVDINGLSQGVAITGGSKADTVTGGNGADNIQLGAGDDVLNADLSDAQNDTANGGEGSDTIKIGNGAATGGEANNTIDLTDFDASTLGGNDAFDDFSNFQNIDASAENTATDDFKLVGNSEDNTLTGGAGQDHIEGGAGDDTLIGGAGADLITTGTGTDTIVYPGYSSSKALDGEGFDGSDSDHVINSTPDDLTESTASNLSAGDFITDFDIATDKIKIDGNLEGALEASGATVNITSAGWDYDAAGIVIVDNSVATVTDFGDASLILTAVDTAAATSTNATNGDEFIVVLANADNTQHGIYYFKDADAGSDLGLDAGDNLSLLGIIDAAGDLSDSAITV